MLPKSLTSILASFLMIAVLFTGCIEDLDPADADNETTINSNCDFIASGTYESTENEAFSDMVIYTFQTPRYDEELDKCYVRYTVAQHVDPIEVFGSSEGLPEGVSNESGFYTHHDVVTDELFIYEEQVSGSFSEFEARWCLYCEGEMGVLVDNITTWKILESGNIEVTYDNGKILKLSECNDCQIDFGKKYYSGFGECKDEHYYSDCSNLEVVNEEPDSSSSSYNVTVDSLEAVFNSMNDDGEYYYDREQWVIHDISEIVEIDGMLMFGVTGKAQEDGYNCGLETWYIFPGESEFTPGQCLLSDKPAWHSEYVPSNDGALWAPNFHGIRTMYYTLPTSEIDGEEDTQSCIGMVTATGSAPDLVWTDYGKPILCQIEGEENNEDPEPPALDPAIFIDDDGKMYMVYGGAHIWITELNPDTGEHISGDPFSWDNGDNGDYVHVANGAEDDPLYTEDDQDSWVEAPYLHKEGDYYYLFVNWYSCCMGPDSTYEIVVGRSDSVTGPYLDEAGEDMKDFGGTLVIAHESHGIIGPGHAGIFEYGTGDNKTQVFTHHYYPDDETPWAYAHARTLTWEDGWPVVSQGEWDPMHYWGITDDSDDETDDSDDETEENSGSCMADSECGEDQVCQQGLCVDVEPETISAEEFYASIIGTFLDGDEDTFYSFFEGDNITLWGGGSLAKSEIRSLDNNLCDDSSDEYCFPLGENYTEYTMDDFNQDYNILTSNFSQISDGYCAYVDPELTDEENKEECLEFSESMNWTSTFGEDDYMANIQWKHEDDGSSSKWIWDDITFMVISEVEGNWQISWWLLG